MGRLPPFRCSQHRSFPLQPPYCSLSNSILRALECKCVCVCVCLCGGRPTRSLTSLCAQYRSFLLQPACAPFGIPFMCSLKIYHSPVETGKILLPGRVILLPSHNTNPQHQPTTSPSSWNDTFFLLKESANKASPCLPGTITMDERDSIAVVRYLRCYYPRWLMPDPNFDILKAMVIDSIPTDPEGYSGML